MSSTIAAIGVSGERLVSIGDLSNRTSPRNEGPNPEERTATPIVRSVPGKYLSTELESGLQRRGRHVSPALQLFTGRGSVRVWRRCSIAYRYFGSACPRDRSDRQWVHRQTRGSDPYTPGRRRWVWSIWKWWTGLDSNQRTLARADLQSAAFNHSATCPQVFALRGKGGRFEKRGRPMPKAGGHVNAVGARFRRCRNQAYDMCGTPLRGSRGGNSVRAITIPGEHNRSCAR